MGCFATNETERPGPLQGGGDAGSLDERDDQTPRPAIDILFVSAQQRVERQRNLAAIYSAKLDNAPVTIVLNDKGREASGDAVLQRFSRGEQVLALDLMLFLT